MADATGSEHEPRRAPVQEPFLNSLCRHGARVSIYLLNGVHLQGTIESFDQFSVMIRNTATQVVYKHAISTVVSADQGGRVPVRRNDARSGHDSGPLQHLESGYDSTIRRSTAHRPQSMNKP